MPDQYDSWLASKLCRLSGEDHRLILAPGLNVGVSRTFAIIGLLVFAIFSMAVFSGIVFLVDVLGGYRPLAFAVGLFWGAMIANMYYLLLFTISPPMLKGRDRAIHGIRMPETTENKVLSRVSLSLRLLFVLCLAVVIAQPALVTLFNTTQWIAQSREKYKAEINDLADKLANNRGQVDRILSTDNFYIQRVQFIYRKLPFSWLVMLSVVLLFMAPIILKYHIRNRSNFYVMKKEFEERVVLNEYARFKVLYSEIFASRFNITTSWFESCTDPPFNTRKKEESNTYSDQQKLLDQIYGDDEDSENNKYIVREIIS